MKMDTVEHSVQNSPSQLKVISLLLEMKSLSKV